MAIKLDLARKIDFEAGELKFEITEPNIRESVEYQKKIADCQDDTLKVLVEMESFLKKLGFPQAVIDGLNQTSLNQIIEAIMPKKKD